MLFLAPIVLIILIIFFIDILYFNDVAPMKKEDSKKTVEKTDNRKNYINKYLK
ncbi:MAG: hypothetical protein JJV95_06870 [Sulfurospirillum sp.]|nr:hypothetical protein [Sulfurospirillum sp.]MBL0703685.1 hypothetical protein [Sulfurospirillum sp.]